MIPNYPLLILRLFITFYDCIDAVLTISQRIILVGGFGDSEYLFDAFQGEFGPSQVAITVPDNP